MYPTYRTKNTAGGFTLLEMMIVIGLLVVLLGAVTMTFVTGLNVEDISLTAGAVRNEASRSLSVISEELKQATKVTAADIHTVTFQADVDGDSAIETISYSWSGVPGDDLVRTQGPGPTILARGVQDASFQYYDSSNVALGPPFPVAATAVRLVEVTLKLGKEKELLQYMTKIRPRGI